MLPFFEKMAVVGVGLIGGSLARAARAKGIVSTIIGIGRGEPNLERAIELGVIDAKTRDLAEGIQEADLIVLATPVDGMRDLLGKVASHVKADAIITDVGSVKGTLVQEAETRFPTPSRFVGGHPIAGTEHSGVEASYPSLFENRMCILTPTEKTDPLAVEKVRQLWEAVGAKVLTMDLVQHDRIMGFVSHLPHMIAYAMVNTIEEAEKKEGNLLDFSAGGFGDFSRIASSHPEMWRDIFLMNRDVLLEAMAVFTETFDELKARLSARDGEGLEEHFRRSRRTRALLLEQKKE